MLGFDALKRALESVFGALTPQALSSQIYGLYTGFVYLTPIFGGLLADRLLGQRRAGHHRRRAHGDRPLPDGERALFFVALMFLILGNGFFKPNISTQVGGLYPPGDPRRDRAFTIFYVGINLGAFLAPLICGTLGESVGWHYGFARGRRRHGASACCHLPDEPGQDADRPVPTTSKKKPGSASRPSSSPCRSPSSRCSGC